MDERVNRRPMPEVELVDMRAEFRDTGTDAIFSRALIEQTQATLDRGEQAIIPVEPARLLLRDDVQVVRRED